MIDASKNKTDKSSRSKPCTELSVWYSELGVFLAAGANNRTLLSINNRYGNKDIKPKCDCFSNKN